MRNIHCELCELHEGCNNPCLWGEGNPRAKLMLVGEAPGQTEDFQGAPFRGQAGKLLSNILTRLGINRDELYLTNVLKCRPHLNKLPTGKKLKVLTDACRPYLDEEIKTVAPKIILALGATAAFALAGVKSVSMVEGTEAAKGVFVAFHPAFVLRSPSKEVRLAMAIALAAKKAGIKVKPVSMEQLPLFKYEVRT